MNTEDERARFQALVMPHFDAAYNLARWLARNDHDAEDVTHEAFVRAMTFFGSLRGTDAKSWVLAIVRNTYLSHVRRSRRRHEDEFDEEIHGTPESLDEVRDANPESQLLRKASAELVNRALKGLPADVREVMILRELEELSYKEIAEVVQVPIGTVMSRLHRGRRLLREALRRLDGAPAQVEDNGRGGGRNPVLPAGLRVARE